jgi:RHS repeat-associated protein
MKIRSGVTVSLAMATALVSSGCSESHVDGDGSPEGLRPPPIHATGAVSFYDSVEFLFQGGARGQAVQHNAAQSSFSRARTAVIRGRVTNESGAPLAGAQVSIPGHPEWGAITTPASGSFDFVVQGGGRVTLRIDAAGRFSAQRSARTRWGKYAVLPDVALLPASAKTTAVDLNGASAWQVAAGDTVSDSNGARTMHVLFPPGVHATAVAQDGTQSALPHGTLRVTEFTRGALGPSAMPGEIAPTVAYTYATALGFDEASAAKTVRFDANVISYVDNFLHKKVGVPVPSGTYVASGDTWSAEPSGRVVAVVTGANGQLALDGDGDGVADNLAGATPGELAALAGFASAGTSYWRVPLAHFSFLDFNDGQAPPDGADGPVEADGNGDRSDERCEMSGASTIACEDQTLGDDIDLVGTGMALHYESDRVPGRTAEFSIAIPITGDTVPPGVKRAVVDVDVLGVRTHAEYATVTPHLTHTFTWNGLDAFGRTWPGTTLASVNVGLVYDGVYLQTPAFGEIPDQTTLTTDPTRQEITLARRYDAPVGVWHASTLGLGGWTLSSHHVYDPDSQVLHFGDGRRRHAQGLFSVTERQAGGNGTGFSGDNGPATDAQLNLPLGVAAAPDGAIFVADSANHRVRKIDAAGIITTIAGTGVAGSAGDGGPAAAAQLSEPRGLALGGDGTLCIADTGVAKVRCIDPGGTIRTVLGGGSTLLDAGTATGSDVLLDRPEELALADDGTLYVQDVSLVYRVGNNGRARVYAGLATTAGDGEGGSARAATLGTPLGIAVGPDGSVYVAEREYHKVRRITPDGTIHTFAGTGIAATTGDGGSAKQAALNEPFRVAVAPDGSVYIAELQGGVIRKVNPRGTISTHAGGGNDDAIPTPTRRLLISAIGGMTVSPSDDLVASEGIDRVLRMGAPLPREQGTQIVIPEQDGSFVYVFDGTGRHLQTLNGSTFAVVQSFGYDADGYLTSVTDADGNAVTLERDGAGRATAIHAPFGQTMTLSYDADGNLASATDPLGRVTALSYQAGGRLTQLVDPRGGSHVMTYDAQGRLATDTSPAGARWTLTRTSSTPVHVDVATALGRTRGHDLQVLLDGTEQRALTYEDGTKLSWTRGSDGTSTTTYPDGTVSVVREDPDPQWGMLAPLVGEQTITLPSGLIASASTTSTATFADGSGALTSLTQLDTSTDDADGTWDRLWDAATRTTTWTTPSGRVLSSVVDAHGRTTQLTVPGITPVTVSYDAHGRVASIAQGTRHIDAVYDATSGFLAEIHDAQGNAVRTLRDAVGRVTSVVHPDGGTLAIGYDPADNATSVAPPGKPAHGLAYNGDDNETSYMPPGSPATLTSYDGDQAFASETRADGSTIAVSRDAVGRVATLTFGVSTIGAAYNAAGRLASLTGPSGNSLAYSYDGFLLTVVTATGAAPGVVRWTYDAKLRVASERVGTGTTIHVLRDLDGLITDVGALSITRDSTGQATDASVDGIQWSYSYDAFGAMKKLTVTALGTTVYAPTYTFDSLARVETKKEKSTTFGYSYDANSRLIGTTKNGVVDATYTYDANGNRTDGGAVIDAQDRMTAGFGATYTYTANGELSTVTSGTSVTTYTYDGRGQLLSAALPAGRGTVTYGLDALGRRITRLLNGSITNRFVYRNSRQVAAEVNASGTVTTRYVYGPLSHTPAYFIRGGATYAIITDHLGSVRSVVRTSDGTVMQSITYDPWGKVLTDSSPGFQPFGFAGGLYDKDTGLVHFGAREYDGATGRWTSKDPGRFAGGSNLYTYSFADPINWFDITGTAPSQVPFRPNHAFLRITSALDRASIAPVIMPMFDPQPSSYQSGAGPFGGPTVGSTAEHTAASCVPAPPGPRPGPNRVRSTICFDAMDRKEAIDGARKACEAVCPGMKRDECKHLFSIQQGDGSFGLERGWQACFVRPECGEPIS